MSKFNLSIIIPVLNESHNIQKLTYKIKKQLHSIDYEIIFVDDNSTDESKIILKKLKKKFKRTLLLKEKNILKLSNEKKN